MSENYTNTGAITETCRNSVENLCSERTKTKNRQDSNKIQPSKVIKNFCIFMIEEMKRKKNLKKFNKIFEKRKI